MALFLILFMMATEAPPPLAGTLCFSEGRECVPTSGTMIEVEKLDSDRLYVWTSEDDRSVVIGELEAGAGVIDLGLPTSADETPEVREDRRTLKLSVSGQAARGWPTDVRFALVESKEKRWVWTLPAGSTRGEMTVHLPVGSSRLFLGASRHRTEMRPIREGGNIALGQVELKPLPSISGRVTRAHEEEIVPVAGAQLMLGDGKLSSTTNEQGVFRAELAEPLPNEMMVMSPGLSTQVVLLEGLGAENDLGEIRLESGVKLTLEVDRPDELRANSVGVRLLRENKKRYEHTEVAKGELRVGDETIQFSDLSSGDYLLIFEGEQDFERMLVLVEVRGNDVTRRVEIRPFRLEGTVTLGDEPVSGGKVGLGPHGHGQTWRAELPIDSEGGFGGVLWQTGKLFAFVTVTDVAGGMLVATSPELGSDPSKWPISYRKRLIHGRVFDAESGAGIEGLGFRLQIERADGVRSYSPVKTAASGEYEILAWEDGTYDLIITSKDHLPKTETVVLTDVDDSRNVDIGLERGTDVTLQLVWTSGQPIAGATILEGVARDGHNPARMHSADAAGLLKLRVSDGETRLLYVIPREGSFAPVRVTAHSSSAERPIRVEVPPPAGSLRIAVKGSDGNDAPPFIVMMRYNGEWIPYPVIGRLRGSRTPGGIEYAGMPAGAFELWAITPSVPVVPNAPPPHPPVRVGLGAGGASAELTVVTVP